MLHYRTRCFRLRILGKKAPVLACSGARWLTSGLTNAHLDSKHLKGVCAVVFDAECMV